MPDEASGYVLTVYFGRGLPPERSEFEDKIKAEKAFTDAKAAAILWQSRTVGNGLGWIKVKEKEAPIGPPPGAAPAPGAAKPAVAVKPAAAAGPAAAGKPISAVPATAGAPKAVPPASNVPLADKPVPPPPSGAPVVAAPQSDIAHSPAPQAVPTTTAGDAKSATPAPTGSEPGKPG